MPKEIRNKTAITIAEAYDLLMQREKDSKAYEMPLSFMQKEALEHARTTRKCSAADAKSLVKDLVEVYGVSTIAAITTTNTLPDTIDELREMLQPDSKKMNSENLQKIIARIEQIERLEIALSDTIEEEEEDLLDKEIDMDQIPEDLLSD